MIFSFLNMGETVATEIVKILILQRGQMWAEGGDHQKKGDWFLRRSLGKESREEQKKIGLLHHPVECPIPVVFLFLSRKQRESLKCFQMQMFRIWEHNYKHHTQRYFHYSFHFLKHFSMISLFLFPGQPGEVVGMAAN